MSGAPQFPIPPWVGAQPLRPGGAAHKAGPTIEQRIEALERGALGRPGPGVVDGCTITSDIASQGGAKWQAPAPAARVSLASQGTGHTTAGGYVSAASLSMTWTTVYDDDVTINANGFEIERAGLYRLTGLQSTSSFGGTAAALVGRFTVNGSAVAAYGIAHKGSVSEIFGAPITGLVRLAAGDDVSMDFYWIYGGGGTVTYTTGSNFTFMEVEWVRP